jgi:uncharacterized membrane protein (UPF0127 family)
VTALQHFGRMRALLIGLLAVGALAVAGGAALARDEATPTFGKGTVTVTTQTHKVELRVEVARTASQQERGLMQRRSLAADAGMVFVYDRPSSGGFWMKNTLIPLDIAFYDVRGRVVRTFRMTPCKRDPCHIYSPGVPYRGALEVNAGSFRRWNLEQGDRIVLKQATTG